MFMTETMTETGTDMSTNRTNGPIVYPEYAIRETDRRRVPVMLSVADNIDLPNHGIKTIERIVKVMDGYGYELRRAGSKQDCGGHYEISESMAGTVINHICAIEDYGAGPVLTTQLTMKLHPRYYKGKIQDCVWRLANVEPVVVPLHHYYRGYREILMPPSGIAHIMCESFEYFKKTAPFNPEDMTKMFSGCRVELPEIINYVESLIEI